MALIALSLVPLHRPVSLAGFHISRQTRSATRNRRLHLYPRLSSMHTGELWRNSHCILTECIAGRVFDG